MWLRLRASGKNGQGTDDHTLGGKAEWLLADFLHWEEGAGNEKD